MEKPPTIRARRQLSRGGVRRLRRAFSSTAVHIPISNRPPKVKSSPPHHRSLFSGNQRNVKDRISGWQIGQSFAALRLAILSTKVTLRRSCVTALPLGLNLRMKPTRRARFAILLIALICAFGKYRPPGRDIAHKTLIDSNAYRLEVVSIHATRRSKIVHAYTHTRTQTLSIHTYMHTSVYTQHIFTYTVLHFNVNKY